MPRCRTWMPPPSRNLSAWPRRSGNKTQRAEVFSSPNQETSIMTDTSRRDALKCLGAGAGTLFTLSGGVFSAFDMAEARIEDVGTPLILQISDTHIGFNKNANPDVIGTLNSTVDAVNELPSPPAFALHT